MEKMVQSRTDTCGALRIGDVGSEVVLAGYYENMRKVSKNLGFLILRDFYGVTQIVLWIFKQLLILCTPLPALYQ